ncbi:hypothetical protein H1235_08690 [Pseudoxanthomonas sp. NC8]|nr:hypothetical protein H1235_08690 [Pseudoxanthomonas sp. NC8]
MLQGESPAAATQASNAPPQDADAASRHAGTPARDEPGKPSSASRPQATDAGSDKAAEAAPAATTEPAADKPEPAVATDSGWPPPGL